MPDNNELPEGTHKIIGGASTTTGGGEKIGGGALGSAGGGGIGAKDGEMLIVTETAVSTIVPAQSGSVGSSRSAPVSGNSGGSVIDKLRSGSDNISGQAAGKARDLVGQGIERSAEALANVSRLVGDTADGLDERLGAEYGDYARRAASAIEDAANSMASKDADELIDDTRNFVRKSPGVALAGAAVVGFALARLIKTGLSGGDDGDDDDNRTTKTRRSGGSSEA